MMKYERIQAWRASHELAKAVYQTTKAYVAWSSLAELWYQLLFSEEMGYLAPEERNRLERMRSQAAQLTWALMRSVSKARKQSAP